MASKAEEVASRCLRAMLAPMPIGATIPDSAEFREALTGLEWFIPEVLAEVYSEWKGESLDGIYAHLAHKTGKEEAEILGLYILLSDQTVTPIHLRLQISPRRDEVSWLELRLGEQGKHGMVRSPYPPSGSIYNRLHALFERIDSIEWVYKVTFGHRSV
jgi:hypothetical protein